MMNSSKLDEQIRKARKRLKNPYAFLNAEGDFDVIIVQENPLGQESEVKHLFHPYVYIDDLEGSNETTQKPTIHLASNEVNSYSVIERKARDLQTKIWKARKWLWSEGVPSEPVDILDPEIAARYIGYDYELSDQLGSFQEKGNKIEVAGIIDPIVKKISVSRRLPHNTYRFTAAHELGHVVLHNQTHMHRDRPIDGAIPRRERTEKEADKFATFYLMPEKLVKKYFEEVFGLSPFFLTEDTAFALNNDASGNIMLGRMNIRDISRVLAKAEYYNGMHVKSLANRFRVSVETMAIRLEELKLIEI